MTEPTKEDKKFIREKIVKQQTDRKRLAVRFARLLVGGAVFGAAAAVTFAVSEPMVKRLMPGDEEPPTIPITIERDTDPDQNASAETMEETSGEAIRPEELRGEIQDIVDRSLKNFTWSAEQVNGYYKALQEVAQQADHGIVTVSPVRMQIDLFDNPVESTDQYAGVVVAINPRELVILTEEGAVSAADSLKVTFSDGSTAAGELRQCDTTAHTAVVAVLTSELSEETLDGIQAFTLGNSYSVKTGDPVIAIGSPAGRVHSVGRGIVTYAARNVQVPDGQTRVFYTDADCDAERGTYFLNLSGQLIGWATDRFRGEETPDVTMIMSVSEYKGILQKLSNGIEVPYIGLMGQDVTETMKEQGIPAGIYITETLSESPAYRAGIQSGDILTEMDGAQVLTVRDFQNRLDEKTAGSAATLTIRRMGQSEYKEIQYTIVIGAR